MAGNFIRERRPSALLTLIVAGEAIFFLPFVLARIFRPTMLTVFGISNTELGTYFSAYGIVAMVSYVFGGTLADRFPARNLMVIALWLTSLGGILMAFVPGSTAMIFIYAFWGVTTIFLFWAALIRATREWGGPGYQGRAFGWLEGGRGGTAALLGTVSFLLFSLFSVSRGANAYQIVIMIVSGITFLSGVLVWVFVPVKPAAPLTGSTREAVKKVIKMLRLPTVWMLAIMIICAYVGYKITDDYSLYAREVLGFSEVGSAGIGTAALWVRAIVAVLAGYLADKLDRTRVISACYFLTAVSGLLTGFGLLPGITGVILMNLTLTAIGIYGVRALYFAIQKEAGIPVGFTGTAVGIVSFVGFTPEVFMSPWMGYLLDKYPGEPGHRYVFLVLALFAFIGLITSFLFSLNAGTNSASDDQ